MSASRGFGGTVLRVLGADEHVVRVVEVHDVVPGFRRVRFASDTLFADFAPGVNEYLRFWFPDPDDPGKEVQRGYTVLEPDPEAGTFACDFVIHEPTGPASGWAAGCAPGDEVTVTLYGSRPFTVPTPEPAGFLFVGDPSSIPAINAMVEAIPAHLPVRVYLEWGDERERAIPVTEHPAATVEWLHRDLTGARVVAALAEHDWTDWWAWAAAERTTVKAVKATLRDDHGFPKTMMKAQAYWIHGKSFGTSRGGSVQAAAKASGEAAPTGEAAPAEEVPAAAAASAPAEGPKGKAGRAGGRWRAEAGAELLRPLRGTLRLAAALQVVLTLAELVPFVLLAEVGRRLLAGEPVDDQWPLARTALMILGAASLLASALMLWLHVVDARFARTVRRRLLAKLSRLPLGWFTERNRATVKAAVTDDTTRLHYYVTHAAVDVVGAVVSPLAVLVYLFTVDARVAAVLLVPILAYVVVFAGMVSASGSKVTEAATWARRMDGAAVGYLDGLPVVRTFGGPGASALRRTATEYLAFLEGWQRPFVRKKATASTLTDATTFLALVVVVGGWLVASDRMAAADLLPFLLLGTTFGPRLLALAYNAGGLREARAAAQRIGVTLTEPELVVRPVTEAAGAPGPAVGDGAVPPGEVRVEGVTFGYRPREPVLHAIDLTLAPGTVTALVGPSGSGKSTLAALVARFHDPDQGRVTVGGTDVRDLAPDDLYRRVGFVLQDVHLVRATLHDNTALARPDATREEVEAAVEAAVLTEVVARLPEGLDTEVGGDVRLSGGEAQRVAVARALLADTPVVVLDEATAFADPESERQVQLALGRLLVGRTVLVIAHRLHTVVDCDRIVVLDGGRVVQQGTHAELVAAPGRYRDLWDLDAGVAAGTAAEVAGDGR